nr:hypothetical protein CFP56_68772 [Quercus suber]
MDPHMKMHWSAIRALERLRASRDVESRAPIAQLHILPDQTGTTSDIPHQIAPCSQNHHPRDSETEMKDDLYEHTKIDRNPHDCQHRGDANSPRPKRFDMANLSCNGHFTTGRTLSPPVEFPSPPTHVNLHGNHIRTSSAYDLQMIPMTSYANDMTPWAYQKTLQNRIHITKFENGAEYDISTYTPIFIYDCLMLPGSLASVLEGKVKSDSSPLDFAYSLFTRPTLRHQ